MYIHTLIKICAYMYNSYNFRLQHMLLSDLQFSAVKPDNNNIIGSVGS